MARIKDVQYSMTGETEAPENEIRQLEISDIAQRDIPQQPEIKYHIFKLVDTKKKGGTYIPNIDDIINPETGREERARLLVGVESIWIKDQKHLDADYVKQNAKSLVFQIARAHV